MADSAPLIPDPLPLDPGYLYRYVIRPLDRSYGLNSTATLSPGKILMKFVRIFPEMYASTSCPFSSSTRNIAFGSGSMIVPVT